MTCKWSKELKLQILVYSRNKDHLQQSSRRCITKPFENKCTVVISEVTEWHLDAAEHTALRKKVYLVSCFCLTSRWLKYFHSAVWKLQLFSVASGFYCAGASNTTHDHHHDVHTAQRPLHVTSSLGAVCTSIPSIVQSHWENL